jgi:DNA-binding transcriptional ArsR family regulator
MANHPYIRVMPRFTHPRLEDVALENLLHALADPARLAIVRRLDADRQSEGEGLACGGAAACDMPRATLSNHFTILRAAGLIESRKQGVQVINRLRRDEIDRRFPGVLAAVLAADAAPA